MGVRGVTSVAVLGGRGGGHSDGIVGHSGGRRGGVSQ